MFKNQKILQIKVITYNPNVDYKYIYLFVLNDT